MRWFRRKKDKSEDVQVQADLAAAANRDEEAERLYREALKADPSNFRAWNNLGCHLGSLNRHQEARDCFFKATQIKSDYFEAWRGLAVAEKNLEHYDEALRICDKVEREFGRSMADVRADTERRRRLGIKPPSGNPYDSTTEFARRKAADRERSSAGDPSNRPDWPFPPYTAKQMFETAKTIGGMRREIAIPTMMELARFGYAPAKDWLARNTRG